jgi:hypothetical protein
MIQLLSFDEFVELTRKRYPFMPVDEARALARLVPAHLRNWSYLTRAAANHARHRYSDYDMLCSLNATDDQKRAARQQVQPQVDEALRYWLTGRGTPPAKRL